MRCIDFKQALTRLAAAALLLWAAGCSSPPKLPLPTAPAPAQAAPQSSSAPGASARPVDPDAPAIAGAASPGARLAAAPRYVKLGPPSAPRSIEELRLQAARRLVAAHPDTSYVAKAPPILLAIPILEIELNADGSVRHISVVRVPTQAQDTTQLAIDAVRRAAPFGDVSKLKKPWKFVETFLFDDDRRFMPRTLDR